jgi:hypothetical protein
VIHRRAFVTGLAAVPIAGRAPVLSARATPRQSTAPVRVTRTGIIYDNRYYGFPDDADDSPAVLALWQNSTWHYHTFPEDTEGVIRHVSTGLTFVTVPVPRNEPPEVELLHLGGDLAVDSARLRLIAYAAQRAAVDGFLDSFKEHRRRLAHAQQAFYFRILDQEPGEDDENPQWTIRQSAPPLLATEGDRFEDLWIYPFTELDRPRRCKNQA